MRGPMIQIYIAGNGAAVGESYDYAKAAISRGREDLEDCLHHFGSARTDLGGPIRLQNTSDITRLNS